MQAHNNNIQEFLGAMKTVFVVPVYQRNYDWLDEHCKRLFYDITHIVESGQEHFLGTICFKTYTSHERSIIDGQQRLTSVSLLLRAMYEFDTDEDNRSEINDQYLHNSGRGIDTDFLRFKLHLNKRDDAVWHIILGYGKDSLEDRLTPAQQKSRVYQNYLLFYDLVSEYAARGGSVGDILEALRSLTIIELEIQQENPQEIFESLNSTGLDLTNVDLLRNYFLMQFSHDVQSKLYDDYWSQIEDLIGVEHMEQFFVDYLIFRRRSDAISENGRRGHITERNLYRAFKNYYLSLPEPDNYKKTSSCFADMKACAELYRNFIFADDADLNKEPAVRKKLFFLLSVNEAAKSCSLLLYLFDLHRRELIDSAMLDSSVDAVLSLVFRSKVCKAKGLDRQFSGNVMQRLENIRDYGDFVDSFWQAITSGKGSYAFPSDAEFQDALEHKDLYQVLRSRGTKYLLYMLEASSPYSKGLAPFSSDTLQIEHIMPQTLSTEWKNYLTKATMEQYESSLGRIGNLALTDYNGEMSNRPFDEKKPIYKDSKYFYTSRVSQYDKWQLAEIDDRSKRLADEALKVWKMPAQYQSGKAVSASLHMLGEDSSQYAYTKPSLLVIGSNEYQVTYWADFLKLFCRQLADEDSDAFVQVAMQRKISALVVESDDGSTSYADNGYFAQVTGNIYVHTVMSSAAILDAMLRIAKAYDAVAGTEYAENVLFALR